MYGQKITQYKTVIMTKNNSLVYLPKTLSIELSQKYEIFKILAHRVAKYYIKYSREKKNSNRESLENKELTFLLHHCLLPLHHLLPQS